MGIPKFYRWLSERYPLLSQSVTMNGAPETDNLYLDMNGIIHNCTHANGDEASSKPAEEVMMLKIFAYIDTLIQIVKPQQLLFMAIDGCAPRAKMNQQRSRRFRSARDAAEAVEAAKRRGEEVPDDAERFDSNCITPGTVFMARLTEHLKFMIRKKQTEDPLWQKPTVILSGHEVPGEGEHKIMEHIRWARLGADYAPNQRHCLYGLDADLIMLSLVTHEPHFYLLREVVKFGGGGRGQPSREVMENPSEQAFLLLHIGLLRDYIDAEFRSDALGYAYDLENTIDDIVFIIMLVGNDFLPPLPTLDIAEGALDTLFAVYKGLRVQLGGYLTSAGNLNVRRLEILLAAVGELEAEVLEERAKLAQEFAAKQGPPQVDELDEADSMDAQIKEAASTSGALPEGWTQVPVKPPRKPVAQMMCEERVKILLQGGSLEGWRSSYYKEKLGVDPVERDALDVACRVYIEGLVWCLQYYYRGVASWNWFYPSHYAPMASDLVGLEAHGDFTFDPGRPFLPYEQLMAVLPPGSHRLLPPAFHPLMLDPRSPIGDFYPQTFELDMEGKRNDWEAVVLVPFIEEARLLTALAGVDSAALSAEERQRNSRGVMLTFKHTPATKYKFSSTMPKTFADLQECISMCRDTEPYSALPPHAPGFGPELLEGTTTGAASPPAFPTLRTLQFRPDLRKAGVNVFGQPSKKESLILRINDRTAHGAQVSAALVAPAVLGRRCHIGWPYLREAVIHTVSDAARVVDKTGERPLVDVGEWQRSVAMASNKLLSEKGVDVGEVAVVVEVSACEGLVREADGSVQKRWSAERILVPLQAAMDKLIVSVMPHLAADAVAKRLLRSVVAQFHNSGATARQLRLSPSVLGQLTGSVWVRTGEERIDIGLNLKSAARHLCMPDYSRPAAGGRGWEYSDKAVDLVGRYLKDFSWIQMGLGTQQRNDRDGFQAQMFFPEVSREEAQRHLHAARKWLEQCEVAKRPLVEDTAEVASEDAIRALQMALPSRAAGMKAVVLENVAAGLLLQPVDSVSATTAAVAGGPMELGDRVAVVVEGPQRPQFGSQGSVVGVHKEAIEILFDEAFVGGSTLQGRCSGACGGYLKSSDVINISNPHPAAGANQPPPKVSRAKSSDVAPNAWHKAPSSAPSAPITSGGDGDAPRASSERAGDVRAAVGLAQAPLSSKKKKVERRPHSGPRAEQTSAGGGQDGAGVAAVKGRSVGANGRPDPALSQHASAAGLPTSQTSVQEVEQITSKLKDGMSLAPQCSEAPRSNAKTGEEQHTGSAEAFWQMLCNPQTAAGDSSSSSLRDAQKPSKARTRNPKTSEKRQVPVARQVEQQAMHPAEPPLNPGQQLLQLLQPGARRAAGPPGGNVDSSAVNMAAGALANMESAGMAQESKADGWNAMSGSMQPLAANTVFSGSYDDEAEDPAAFWQMLSQQHASEAAAHSLSGDRR
eukprot:gene5821-7022_t